MKQLLWRMYAQSIYLNCGLIIYYKIIFDKERYKNICTTNLAGAPLVTNTLNRVATSVYILQKTAAQLRDSKFATLIAQWNNSVTECVQELLEETKEKGQGENKVNDGCLFLLHQIHPSHQLVQVLRSGETLEKLGLTNYFVAENILNILSPVLLRFLDMSLIYNRYISARLPSVFVHDRFQHADGQAVRSFCCTGAQWRHACHPYFPARSNRREKG